MGNHDSFQRVDGNIGIDVHAKLFLGLQVGANDMGRLYKSKNLFPSHHPIYPLAKIDERLENTVHARQHAHVCAF